MRLLDFVIRYADARDISAAHIAQLRYSVAGLDKFAGRPVCTCDLSPELLNAYLRQMKESRCSDSYRKSRRLNLLTLWAAAADAGLATEPSRRKIMRIAVRDRITHAWSVEQVRHLLAVAKELPGMIGHIPRCLYWPAYVAAAWDSGLRGVDLRSFERTWVRPSMQIVQRKTGRRVRVQLRQSTIGLIWQSFPPDRAHVWPQGGCIRQWRHDASEVVKAAGLTGSIGRLRHSSGTALEKESPGHGHEHLGNGRKVFERHYLDESQIEDTRPLPPEL